MNPVEKEMMFSMISILNDASYAYYNTGNPIMSDKEFDMRLEDLKELEKETGVIFSNSPTQDIVGWPILDELPKAVHNHKMLSLNKCHSIQEIVEFSNNKKLVASVKLDGMTASLLYENGIFVKGESRGNGYVGVDITEHIKQFMNIPLKINKKNRYIVDGECIISNDDFAKINQNGEYKNSRNLIAGTLNSLDTTVVSQRRAKFIVWDVIEGGSSDNLTDNLNDAESLGFSVVPFWYPVNLESKKLQSTLDYVFEYASDEGLPCDGVVFKFNDIEYGKSLGSTNHHFKDGIAYKKEDDVYKTKLIDVEWNCGKSGQLTPVAIFEPVDIDGSTITKSTVHNVSILEELNLCIGDTIEIFKANQVIPAIKRNVSAEQRQYIEAIEAPTIYIPEYCPICGCKTKIKQDNNSKVLVCTNENCKGKLLGKLTHYVSKNAMDIKGLSESTLEKFIELGWINDFKDIYLLKHHAAEMVKFDGFGEASVKKLLNSIEKSRITTLDRFIYSLSVPLIGRSASKIIAEYFNYDFNGLLDNFGFWKGFDWTTLDGFGKAMSDSMDKFITDNVTKYFVDLPGYLIFKKPETTSSSNSLEGKVFCITGSLNHFANRDEVKEKIESLGGKVSGSVNTKTDYLVCNEASNSSKYKKAQSLGVRIVDEDELIKMLK
jgi:DNA ligase (NAD+)